MLDSGHYWQSPYIEWSPEISDGWALFVVHTRTSRIKARVPAVLEVLSLLGPLQPTALLRGPLADAKGVFWIAVAPGHTEAAIQLFPRLGYVSAVDRAIPVQHGAPADAAADEQPRTVAWNGARYNLVRVFEEDQQFLRARAPDMRTFLLESEAGDVRPVKGYRGDGATLSRRGLPVADARLLVNLVTPRAVLVSRDLAFLDPFGGVGGIVLEAIDRGFTVYSVDSDRRLRPGLEQLGARHHVADATQLPFGDHLFTAIATEPPYHPSTRDMLATAFTEMVRVLAPGGGLAMLVAPWQVPDLLDASPHFGLRLRLACPINRKGTDVAVLAWEKMVIRQAR